MFVASDKAAQMGFGCPIGLKCLENASASRNEKGFDVEGSYLDRGGDAWQQVSEYQRERAQ